VANWNGNRWQRRGSRRTTRLGYQSDVTEVSSINGGVVMRVGPDLSGHGNVVRPATQSQTRAELEATLKRQQSNRKGI
jgi:hypothetical protein